MLTKERLETILKEVKKMGKNYYGTGEVSRKLGIPPRTARDWARKGKIPGQLPFWEPAHRRFRSEVIDRLATGNWPPIQLALKGKTLEIEICALANEPVRVDPYPGELPEINFPQLGVPGLAPLPAWHLPRIPSPFEFLVGLGQVLWG
jgi:hypothetical protein